MGRRRWKQYQDNLYSGTRSSESATTQPHVRLHPALSSCNPLSGSVDQIGPQLLHPVPSSLPSTVTSTVLTTETATTTTTTTTGLVKQERHLHLQNHHQHPSPPIVQDHSLQSQQQDDSHRLRPGEVKAVADDEEPTDGVREDTSTRTADTATSTATTTEATTTATTISTGIAITTTSSTTTATGTTTIATRRRRGRRQNEGEDVDGENDDEEKEEETGRSEKEKRLKLNEDADRSVSPLRTENDRTTRDHPTANATDTEGTKVSNKFDMCNNKTL